MKCKMLKVLMICFSEHSESRRLCVSLVAWILLFMYWIYYGQLNKENQWEKVVIGKDWNLH